MLARGRGGIILIGSLAGNAGGRPLAAYCGSKAFTQRFAEGIWSEMKPKGVDVLYVVVGAVATPNRARQGIANQKGPLDAKDDPNQIVATPEQTAQEALDNIANGPVFCPPQLVGFFDRLSTLPRAEAATLMTGMLTGFRDESPAH
jgi:short-subunit dehydrogenase